MVDPAYAKKGVVRLRWLLALMAILPLPAAALRVVGGTKRVSTGTSGGSVLVRDVPLLFAFAQGISATYSVTSLIVCIYFELRTVFIYQSFSAKAKKAHRNDFLLLIYALLQFCVQLALSAYFCVMNYAAAVENHALVATVQAVNPYLNDLFCFSAPICLLATSGAVRQAYKDTYWCRSSSGDTRVTRVSTASSSATKQ